MTRVLQIRRGTSTQNDNFTGLNGEITFDTTNKTVRVHDGETLGGIALARHDEIPENMGNFDINSVESSFWTELFSTYQTKKLYVETSAQFPIFTNNFMDHTFAQCDVMPICVDAVLVNQTPEHDYSIGDEVRSFGIGTHTCPKLNVYLSNDALHACLFSGGQSFWVYHKTNGTPVNITNENWKIKFTVYYCK